MNSEQGFLQNVTTVRDLSWQQPYEVEDVLSLTYPAPLHLNKATAENLLSFYNDLWWYKENSFGDSREPKVMARVLLRILCYINRHKFPGLEESQWPLRPFFIRLIRMLVKQVSKFKGCSFLQRSTQWRYAKWYFCFLAKLVKANWFNEWAIQKRQAVVVAAIQVQGSDNELFECELWVNSELCI